MERKRDIPMNITPVIPEGYNGPIGDCDTPPRLKSRGFFCLSSVRGALRSAAWPRLGEYRSGGGKARRQRIHSCICFLGGAMPVAFPMPCARGKNGPQLTLGLMGEEQHPHLSTLNPGEHAHQGGGFSWRYSCKEAALPKAVHPSVSCLRSV